MPEPHFKNYLAIESAGGATWHQKEDKIAFVYNSQGFHQIYTTKIVKNQRSWPQRLTFEEDRCTDPLYLSDDTLIFHKDEGGNENFQFFLINKGLEQIQLTHNADAKHILAFATDDYIYYRANDDSKIIFNIYRRKIPLVDNEPELLYRPDDGFFIPAKVDENEQKLGLVKVYSSNHTEIHILNLHDNTTQHVTEQFQDNRTNRWLISRIIDDKSILTLTDYGAQYVRPALIHDKELITFDEFTQKPFNFGPITYSRNTDSYFVITNEHGNSKLYNFKIEENKFSEFVNTKIPVEGVILSGDQRSFSKGIVLSENERFLALTVSNSTSPANIWIIDLKENLSWCATQTSTPGIDPKSFRKETLEKFSSYDNLEVPYFKYLPVGSRPDVGWPAIFVIHGGPEAQYRPSFNTLAQYFMTIGIALIAPNIRGSAGYYRDYMDLDNKEKRLDSILDIKHLALHLTENDPDIDGSNLIVFGGSYGGFAVLSSLVEHPEIWKAGVDIVGISNFVTFLENTAPWRRKLREGEYGSLDEDREMLERISPNNKLDNLRAPLFIIQGDNDERVPLSESIQMYNSLKEKGLEVELLRFADEGHGIAKRKNQIVAYPKVANWIKEILKS